MSKHRVAVLKVISGQMSVTAAAVAAGMSRQHLHRLLGRYREGGLEALEPRSRRPRSNPGRTPEEVSALICFLGADESSESKHREMRKRSLRKFLWSKW